MTTAGSILGGARRPAAGLVRLARAGALLCALGAMAGPAWGQRLDLDAAAMPELAGGGAAGVLGGAMSVEATRLAARADLAEDPAERASLGFRAAWRRLAAGLMAADPSREGARALAALRLRREGEALDALAERLAGGGAARDADHAGLVALEAAARAVARVEPTDLTDADAVDRALRGVFEELFAFVAAPPGGAGWVERGAAAPDPREAPGALRATLAQAGMDQSLAERAAAYVDALERALGSPAYAPAARDAARRLAGALDLGAAGSRVGWLEPERVDALRAAGSAYVVAASDPAADRAAVAARGDALERLGELLEAADRLVAAGQPSRSHRDLLRAAVATALRDPLLAEDARAADVALDTLRLAAEVRERPLRTPAVAAQAWSALRADALAAEDAAVQQALAALAEPALLTRPATASALSAHRSAAEAPALALRAAALGQALTLESARANPGLREPMAAAAKGVDALLALLQDDATRGLGLRRLARLEEETARFARADAAAGDDELPAAFRALLARERARWLRSWERGDPGVEARDLAAAADLLALLDDARSVAAALERDASAPRWPGLVVPAALLAADAEGVRRTGLDLASRWDGQGAGPREAALRELRTQAATLRLAAAVVRATSGPDAGAADPAAAALAGLAIPPGRGAWMAHRREELARVSRWAHEFLAAARDGDEELAQRIRRAVAPIADALTAEMGRLERSAGPTD